MAQSVQANGTLHLQRALSREWVFLLWLFWQPPIVASFRGGNALLLSKGGMKKQITIVFYFCVVIAHEWVVISVRQYSYHRST